MKQKYKQFCYEYLRNGHNATKAMQAVKTYANNATAQVAGHRWLKKPEVADFLKHHLAQTNRDCEITRDWKIDKLKLVILSSIVRGENDCDVAVDSKSIVSAVAELNKMQGHYSAEKYEHDVKHVIDVDFKAILEKFKRDY